MDALTRSIIRFDELPHTRHSHEFVGADHGDVPFSIILVHSQPGAGPAVHTHPYAEVFVVDAGQATFVLGDETVVVVNRRQFAVGRILLHEAAMIKPGRGNLQRGDLE